MNVRHEGPDLLIRLMSAAQQRQDILANNVASQNLPGYRRQDVRFEEALATALSEGQRVEDLDLIDPEVVTDWDSPVRADGNNVSAEEESSRMRENRIRFELYAMILRSRTSLVTQAIVNDR